MFATAGEITSLENMIKSVLNAASTGFAAAIDDSRRTAEAIAYARKMATMDVINAIALNPQHGYWGTFAVAVTVTHDSFLPSHCGTHGIPVISRSVSLPFQEGLETDPDEIDSYRNDTLGLFTRINGEIVAHDAVDSNGMPSSVSGRWSIVNKKFKFTGRSAKVPLITIPDATTDSTYFDTHTPVEYIPTIVKLSPFYNLKEGDNLMGLASSLYQAGQSDLMQIAKGIMTVSPVSDVMEVQKEI